MPKVDLLVEGYEGDKRIASPVLEAWISMMMMSLMSEFLTQ